MWAEGLRPPGTMPAKFERGENAAESEDIMKLYDFNKTMIDIMASDHEYGDCISAAAAISAFSVCKYCCTLKAPAHIIAARDKARREIAARMNAAENISTAAAAESAARDEITYLSGQIAAAARKTAPAALKAAAPRLRGAIKTARAARDDARAAVIRLDAALWADTGADMMQSAAAALIDAAAAVPPTAEQTAAEWMQTRAAALGDKSPKQYAAAAARRALRGADITADQIDAAAAFGHTVPAPQSIDESGIFGLIAEIAAAAELTETETETVEMLYRAESLRAAAPLCGVSAMALVKRRRRIAAKLTAAAENGLLPPDFAAKVLDAAAEK